MIVGSKNQRVREEQYGGVVELNVKGVIWVRGNLGEVY